MCEVGVGLASIHYLFYPPADFLFVKTFLFSCHTAITV